MKTPKVVIDTNVLVSGTISSKGNPAQIVDAWRQVKLQNITSQKLLSELRRVLFYPRVQQASGWSSQENDRFVDDVRMLSLVSKGELKLSVIKQIVLRRFSRVETCNANC